MHDFRKILPPASRKIVNPAHFVALGQNSARERRADESRNTRDEISSHILFYPMSQILRGHLVQAIAAARRAYLGFNLKTLLGGTPNHKSLTLKLGYEPGTARTSHRYDGIGKSPLPGNVDQPAQSNPHVRHRDSAAL
jgi:hypothetical protein